MGKFVEHEEFKRMNVGFGLDEGLANPTEAFTVFNGERSGFCKPADICVCSSYVHQSDSFSITSLHVGFTVTCPGNPGHGSRFIENTAAEKVV